MPRIVSLLVIALLLTGTVRAQPAPRSQSAAPSERPTIALVLSGGAAKGLAHIGVIQVFEEEGIPFDIIAGTSAGALIGSFYAVGYTGRQIENIVRSAGPDLNDLFFDRIDATMLRIEETRIPDETLVSLPIDQFRPRLPEGVVAGQRVIQLVSKYTWGYHHIEDFSHLPRPYVCNAVDLVSGRDIALTKGFLPEAARACISLPGFFEPFEQDSLLLVDGGTSHNLPVPEAKAIGGEVLVGVDVGDDIGPDGEVQLNATGNEGSLLFNLMKNLTFNRRSVLLEHRSQLALVVDPDVSGVSVFDFNTASVFIERGRQAARAMTPEIRAFLDELGSPQPRRDIEPPSLAPVRVDRMDIHGVTGAAAELVRDLLGFDLTIPGMVGPDDMDRAISRIYATELFETAVYKLIPGEGDRPTTIQVEVTPLEEPNNIAVGFRYDDLYAASLLVTLELRNKLRYGSTTGLVFRLGRQLRIGAEYFTRLGRTAPITAGASADFRSGPLRYGSVLTGRFPVEDDDRPRLRQNLFTGRVSLGYTLDNTSLVGLRGQASRYTEVIKNYPITDEELLFVDGRFRAPDYEGSKFIGRYVSGGAFLEAEDFDRRAFPTHGYRLLLNAETGVAARDDDDVIKRIEELLGPVPRAPQNNTFQRFRHFVANMDAAAQLRPAVALLGRFGLSHGRGDGLPLTYLTAVGGIHTNTVFAGSFYPLPGLDSQERLGTTGWITALGVQWEFRSKCFLQVFGNSGDAYFDLDLTDEEADADPELAALDGFDLSRAALGLGINLGWSSPIGPVVVSAGQAEGGPLRLGFNAGYRF